MTKILKYYRPFYYQISQFYMMNWQFGFISFCLMDPKVLLNPLCEYCFEKNQKTVKEAICELNRLFASQ